METTITKIKEYATKKYATKEGKIPFRKWLDLSLIHFNTFYFTLIQELGAKLGQNWGTGT